MDLIQQQDTDLDSIWIRADHTYPVGEIYTL